MPFQSLDKLRSDVARKETWGITLSTPQMGLPAGQYDFLEAYCDEAGCDCRRVWFSVLCTPLGADPITRGRIRATVGYGWEPTAFYQQWMGDDEEGAELAGLRLEPLQKQSDKAEHLLKLTAYLLQQPGNLDWVKRHYAAVREVVDRPRKPSE